MCIAAQLCIGLSLSAQSNNYPKLIHIDSAEVWFDRIVSQENAAIVNGPAYQVPFKGLKTHPFYQSAQSEKSNVLYDNDLYKNVDLLYDSYSDILVLKNVTPGGIYFVKLDQNLVQSFDLHKHYFKKFDEGINSGIGVYFDVLVEKPKFAVVVKRRKLERLDGNTSDYLVDDVSYILNNGKWTRITGKSSFSKQLHRDQRKQLNAFIKNNNINTRKRIDEDLKKLGAFCYSLKATKP